jgi:hypothetical protein
VCEGESTVLVKEVLERAVQATLNMVGGPGDGGVSDVGEEVREHVAHE